MRYRIARPADLPICQGLIGPGFRASPRVASQLLALWENLRSSGAVAIHVMEDPERPSGKGIEAFALCAFVSDAFIAEFCRAPQPYLSAIIYERVLDGLSPVLGPAEVRTANSGPGLNFVGLHFATRNPALGDARTRQALQVANTAFFFFFSGYRIVSIMQEVYGPEQAAYMQAGGLRLRTDFAEHFADKRAKPPPNAQPYLFGLTKDEIAPGAVYPLSFLFQPLPPRFGFSPSAQHLLERALLSMTDAQVAQDLGVSVDAIKKTWRAIYHRVDEVAPRLFESVGHAVEHQHRSGERRRYVLEYLRTHLEELRPTVTRRKST
ncbi:MAG: hypothetical protein ACREYD_00920 [Casimicrobiaceae bacterium]